MITPDKYHPNQFNMTPEMLIELRTLAGFLNDEQIANFFGISQDTLMRYLAKDEDAMRIYKRAKSEVISIATSKLYELVKAGNLGAICFFLKCRAGWQEVQKIELTAHVPQIISADAATTTALGLIAERGRALPPGDDEDDDTDDSSR